MPYTRALHRREASLLRCKAVLRRASYGLAHSRLAHVHTRDRSKATRFGSEPKLNPSSSAFLENPKDPNPRVLVFPPPGSGPGGTVALPRYWRPPHLNTTPLPWSIPLLCGASSADVYPVAEILEEVDSSRTLPYPTMNRTKTATATSTPREKLCSAAEWYNVPCFSVVCASFFFFSCLGSCPGQHPWGMRGFRPLCLTL